MRGKKNWDLEEKKQIKRQTTRSFIILFIFFYIFSPFTVYNKCINIIIVIGYGE